MTPSTQHRDPIARALSLGTDGRSVKAWAEVLSTIPCSPASPSGTCGAWPARQP